MKPQFKHYIFLVLLLFFQNSFAQNDKDFITGVLLDAQTNEAVVFASIRVKDAALGVISNLDGDFRVPLDFAGKGAELEISSMGYETKYVVFTSLTPNEINVIYLQPALLQLNEAVVTGRRKRLSAKKIIKKAIANIPNNYPVGPFNLVGYYRDYQLNEKEYVNLNEAIVGIYDQGFANNDYLQTQYSLYSYEQNTTFKIDSFAARPYDYSTRDKFIPSTKLISDYGGNELVILNIHDAVRNHDVKAYSYVHRLVSDFIKEHRFPKMEATSYNGKEVFKITIRKKQASFYVEGAIYIDKDDYAIRKLDYATYKSDVGIGRKRRTLLYEILVEYKEENEKMYLNYISFHNIFTVRRPAEFRVEQVFLDKENGLLDVKFNKPMSNYEAIDGGITIYVQDKRLRVANILQSGQDELKVILSSRKDDVALRNKLFTEFEDEAMLEVFIDIKNLKDSEGNLLNERKEETLDQFREFFTQKVIKSPKPVQQEVLMYKNIPIYNSRQPRYGSGDHDDFWLNTPLKKAQ